MTFLLKFTSNPPNNRHPPAHKRVMALEKDQNIQSLYSSILHSNDRCKWMLKRYKKLNRKKILVNPRVNFRKLYKERALGDR